VIRKEPVHPPKREGADRKDLAQRTQRRILILLEANEPRISRFHGQIKSRFTKDTKNFTKSTKKENKFSWSATLKLFK
jgi:hypothetical protein